MMDAIEAEVNRGPKFKRRMIVASRDETPFSENLLILLSYLFLIITFPLTIWGCFIAVKVYQRVVIFRIGRLRGFKVHGPGLVFYLPCVDECIVVDVRTQSFDVTPQEILTRDSVTIQVDGVVYFNIQDPLNTVMQIENVRQSTKFLAQTTLRNVVGTKDLVELLAEKESLSKTIEQILDDATAPWGVKVERVEM